MNQRRATYLAVITSFVLFTVGMTMLQQRLLNEIFPTEERIFLSGDTPWRRDYERLTIEYFGIDPALGQAGVLRQFGRPLKARYFPPAPSPFRRDAFDEFCVYTYPTFEVRFQNKGFGSLEIFARDTRFPLGVAVGDPEQRVLDVFGSPPYHHASGDWTARYPRLTIEVKNGRVARISW